MTLPVEKLSDYVIFIQGRTLPICSQVLALQSGLFYDLLESSTFETAKDGRKILPIDKADDCPAMLLIFQAIYMPSDKLREILHRQDLDTVDSMLELTSKYQLSELQQSLFDELLESARYKPACRQH